jgi:hypothetical protein
MRVLQPIPGSRNAIGTGCSFSDSEAGWHSSVSSGGGDGSVKVDWLAEGRLARSRSMAAPIARDKTMWALVIFTFATSSIASATVTTLEFNTQQLCLIAARELDALSAPVVSEGVARYKVLTACVQTSEVAKK